VAIFFAFSNEIATLREGFVYGWFVDFSPEVNSFSRRLAMTTDSFY